MQGSISSNSIETLEKATIYNPHLVFEDSQVAVAALATLAPTTSFVLDFRARVNVDGPIVDGVVSPDDLGLSHLVEAAGPWIGHHAQSAGAQGGVGRTVPRQPLLDLLEEVVRQQRSDVLDHLIVGLRAAQ